MSSKLNSEVCHTYMRGGAARGMLTGKGRYGVVCRCDPYLSALEAFAKTRYTNRRYLYLYHVVIHWQRAKSEGRYIAICPNKSRYLQKRETFRKTAAGPVHIVRVINISEVLGNSMSAVTVHLLAASTSLIRCHKKKLPVGSLQTRQTSTLFLMWVEYNS